MNMLLVPWKSIPSPFDDITTICINDGYQNRLDSTRDLPGLITVCKYYGANVVQTHTVAAFFGWCKTSASDQKFTDYARPKVNAQGVKVFTAPWLGWDIVRVAFAAFVNGLTAEHAEGRRAMAANEHVDCPAGCGCEAKPVQLGEQAQP